jgi:uncharacterized membrane protein YesL
MLDGLRVLRRSLRLFYDGMFYLAIGNFLWVVLALFILPIPAVTAALFYVGHRAARDEVIQWRRVWSAVRSHLRTIYVLGFINLLVYLILLFDLLFYADTSGFLGIILYAASLALLILWTMIQANLLPILFDSEEKGVWFVLRKAVLMLARYPIFYAVIYIFFSIVAVISTIFIAPWGVVTLGYFALVLNIALLDRQGYYAALEKERTKLV